MIVDFGRLFGRFDCLVPQLGLGFLNNLTLGFKMLCFTPFIKVFDVLTTDFHSIPFHTCQLLANPPVGKTSCMYFSLLFTEGCIGLWFAKCWFVFYFVGFFDFFLHNFSFISSVISSEVSNVGYAFCCVEEPLELTVIVQYLIRIFLRPTLSSCQNKFPQFFCS